METHADYSDDIKTIKRIMEESSRFLSISGLTGIFSGAFALIGGMIAQVHIMQKATASVKIELAIDAVTVFILALTVSLWLSFRSTQKKGQKFLTPVSRRLLINFLIPLVSGAIFVLILYTESQWQLIVPVMLIFYGLALVNAGKFTYSEVFYLGLAELITGLLSAFIQDFPILFWMFGFSVLNLIFGFAMFRKYKE